jgi:hypothetical protein
VVCRYFVRDRGSRVDSGNENRWAQFLTYLKSRYRFELHGRADLEAVEVAGCSGYTLPRRGGRVVECGGLENRYVGNPGVGGSNPPLSAPKGHRFSECIQNLWPEAFNRMMRNMAQLRFLEIKS